MYFQTGNQVEVASKEEAGFLGSYYEATVVAKISRHNQYVVEYKTLVEDDLSAPLQEVVPFAEVIPATKFRYFDCVDAFDNVADGDPVEISSKQEGFLGSYYEATVVAKIPRHNQYVVEYKTLLEDDLSAPLREVVPAAEVRPPPPVIRATKFRYCERVDAFDNDGWWAGTVSVVDFDEGKYFVYFEIFGVTIGYDAKRLRIHQDWKNGRWLLP